MKRFHSLWIVPLALLLAIAPLTTVTMAQEATPGATPMADAASPTEGPILTLVPEAYFPGEGSTASPGGDLPGDPQIELVKVAGGFLDPINVASPPDGSGRLFVVERPGTIRIIDGNGQVREEPFLDITDQVLSQFLEDGLLDLVFDPNFAENGYFYIDYTSLLYNGDVFLMRYQVSPDDPNRADPDSGEVIMFRDQIWANHVGGSLVFGPDGYLYIGVATAVSRATRWRPARTSTTSTAPSSASTFILRARRSATPFRPTTRLPTQGLALSISSP
ncbi:MAG: PQQ-dependent sugar dehydrogenase [Chloroflexi bacterium]|nr:PQQ-dependent sugar dehydrogenase [Chloroflexota bacterium]